MRYFPNETIKAVSVAMIVNSEKVNMKKVHLPSLKFLHFIPLPFFGFLADFKRSSLPIFFGNFSHSALPTEEGEDYIILY